MGGARWETGLKSVKNQSRENAIIRVAVHSFARDGCTLYTQSPMQDQIHAAGTSQITTLLVQGHLEDPESVVATKAQWPFFKLVNWR